MFQVFYAGGIQGMNAYKVRVEADVSNGLPGFEMVGSLACEVREAKERVRVAMKNAGFPLPVARITVNLSPAQIKKEGTGYDLAIATAILACMGMVKKEGLDSTAFLGELALSGEVHKTDGALPIALQLQKDGIQRLVVPCANVEECRMVPGLTVVPMRDMQDLSAFLRTTEEKRKEWEVRGAGVNAGQDRTKFMQANAGQDRTEFMQANSEQNMLDFSQVSGQESMKRAACVAAAGFETGSGNRSVRNAQYAYGRAAGSRKNHDCPEDSGNIAAAYEGRAAGGYEHLQYCRKTSDKNATFSGTTSYDIPAGTGGRRQNSKARRFVTGSSRNFVPG